MISPLAITTSAVVSRADRLTQGVTAGLVRLSVGAEDVGDILINL
ncbi:MAG: PLP-dependent transferase [Anaerolineae bacterium]|nr:PLP-dependent transferase [Anaerolineae bacterium]